jgi:hypothetical protein
LLEIIKSIVEKEFILCAFFFVYGLTKVESHLPKLVVVAFKAGKPSKHVLRRALFKQNATLPLVSSSLLSHILHILLNVEDKPFH